MTVRKNKPIDFTRIGVRAYVGRPNGEKARVHFNIEDFDLVKSECSVDVIFPDTTRTISSSFFLGMFGKSILNAGDKAEFYKRYNFKAKEHILNQIDKSVDRALASLNSAYER
ncbi:hypothetical protein [Alteromonas lipotrueiana]|uniref:hypothetical protein n=1 Tax=Alteromonas lipotrueiana TaxID=2803815 RepID=UPI001C489428|nr:hypothetical protein [Alteromonas lipotrueiana]